jgi:hypothetical protein
VTRVIRATYGSHVVYTRMAVRALERWQEYDAQWKAGLLRQTGALWLLGADTSFGDASAKTLGDEGISLDELGLPDAERRFPQIAFDGISRVLFEPDAGYLFASRACAHVADRVVVEGGSYRQAAAASPVAIDGRGVGLADGSSLDADCFVFCGPGSAPLPGHRRQPRHADEAGGTTSASLRVTGASPVRHCPSGWNAASNSYGMPADDGHGFKFADDARRRHRSDAGRAAADDGGRRAREPVSGRPIPRSVARRSSARKSASMKALRTRISSSTVILTSPASRRRRLRPRLQDGTRH